MEEKRFFNLWLYLKSEINLVSWHLEFANKTNEIINGERNAYKQYDSNLNIAQDVVIY